MRVMTVKVKAWVRVTARIIVTTQKLAVIPTRSACAILRRKLVAQHYLRVRCWTVSNACCYRCRRFDSDDSDMEAGLQDYLQMIMGQIDAADDASEDDDDDHAGDGDD
jgi:hypothetical protein